METVTESLNDLAVSCDTVDSSKRAGLPRGVIKQTSPKKHKSLIMIGSLQACKLPACDFAGSRTPRAMSASLVVPRDSGTHNAERRCPRSTFSLFQHRGAHPLLHRCNFLEISAETLRKLCDRFVAYPGVLRRRLPQATRLNMTTHPTAGGKRGRSLEHRAQNDIRKKHGKIVHGTVD